MAGIHIAAPRILVLEDYWLLAIMAKALFEDAGCVVIGPIGEMAEATRIARSESLDGAALDVHLGDEMSYPVADILAARRIPFGFVTGSAAGTLPGAYASRPHFGKPYSDRMVARFLDQVGVRRPAARSAASG